jgi:outer membrane protein OmpA-like peptidoglycan-associated protein
MAIRFHGREDREGARRASGRGGSAGDPWIVLGAIALALVTVAAVSGGAGRGFGPGGFDPRQLMLEAVVPAERSLAEIESAFATLCQEPLLIGLELEPDCATGVITLPDSYFATGRGTPRIRPEAREYIAAAMTTWLNRLRQLPALYDSLEAIEIRGHGDPRSIRGGYPTSLAASHQRALATLLFLVGPNGVSAETDRIDLERLAVVSGSAYSRPPADCPEPTAECLVRWRRVEIRPVLSETLRRGDWARTIESLRVSTAGLHGAEPAPGPPTP